MRQIISVSTCHGAFRTERCERWLHRPSPHLSGRPGTSSGMDSGPSRLDHTLCGCRPSMSTPGTRKCRSSSRPSTVEPDDSTTAAVQSPTISVRDYSGDHIRPRDHDHSHRHPVFPHYPRRPSGRRTPTQGAGRVAGAADRDHEGGYREDLHGYRHPGRCSDHDTRLEPAYSRGMSERPQVRLTCAPSTFMPTSTSQARPRSTPDPGTATGADTISRPVARVTRPSVLAQAPTSTASRDPIVSRSGGNPRCPASHLEPSRWALPRRHRDDQSVHPRWLHVRIACNW